MKDRLQQFRDELNKQYTRDAIATLVFKAWISGFSMGLAITTIGFCIALRAAGVFDGP